MAFDLSVAGNLAGRPPVPLMGRSGDTIRSAAPSLPVFPTLTSPVRSPQTGFFFHLML
jgi:hypothetical protein